MKHKIAFERLENIASMMEQDVDAALAYQQRPKGGQQVGPPSTPFLRTPPSGLVAIKRYTKWIREAIIYE